MASVLDLFIIIIFSYLIIYVFYKIIKNKINRYEEKFDEEIIYDKSNYGRILMFNLINNSDEELELDLCRLDNKDSRYNFETSGGDYEKLVSYLKSYNLNISSTKVLYNHSDWQKDIIKLNIYNPFENIKTPIFVAMDDFMIKYAHKNIIESRHKYHFNYFSTLLVKLKPKESKNIKLFVVEEEEKNEELPLKSGVILKNNTDEIKKVKLFDKMISGIEYKSLFDINTYEELINFYKRDYLVVKELRLYSKNMDTIRYKINFDEHNISSPFQENHYYIINLEDDRCIAMFEIEIEPKSELIITF